MLEMSCQVTGIERLQGILSSERIQDLLISSLGEATLIGKKETITEMKRVFDRPTPWILKGVKTKISRKDLTTQIYAEMFPTGRSQADVLSVQAVGGTRPKKRSEQWLGSYYVPGKGARLNQYGNIPGSEVTRILATLKVLPAITRQNVTPQSKKRAPKKVRKYFIPLWGLKKGVWEHKGAKNKVVPIMIFIGPPGYRVRLLFHQVNKNAVDSNMQRLFNNKLESFVTVGTIPLSISGMGFTTA